MGARMQTLCFGAQHHIGFRLLTVHSGPRPWPSNSCLAFVRAAESPAWGPTSPSASGLGIPSQNPPSWLPLCCRHTGTPESQQVEWNETAEITGWSCLGSPTGEMKPFVPGFQAHGGRVARRVCAGSGLRVWGWDTLGQKARAGTPWLLWTPVSSSAKGRQQWYLPLREAGKIEWLGICDTLGLTSAASASTSSWNEWIKKKPF